MILCQLTSDEATAFAARLDAFGKELSYRERVCLQTILYDAEAAVENGGLSRDDAGTRTFGEMVVEIHRAHLLPPISLNPQPIPPGPRHVTDVRRDGD